MSLASRRWGRADRRGQILADDPLFVKALQQGSEVRCFVGLDRASVRKPYRKAPAG
jgi:hypothetical protein